MFSCRDATDLMTEASEGALTGSVRFKHRLHMLICAGCKAYRKQLAETVALVKEIPGEGEAVPREVEERLVEAFRARKGSRG